MAGPAKTQMTLLESMRDDAKRLRDVLSHGFNGLFAHAKPTTPSLVSSAIPEEPGAVFDAHVRAEFVEQSVDATMATMTDTPYVTHVPVMTGGYGRDEVRQFYATWFIGRWPADVQITPISRTVGQGRAIDELIVSFTHDVEIPALLPGIAPTGRKVTLPHVVVMGIVNGKVAYEHIYWDQASLLA
jgi:carboxymethylenebutenolidase